MSKKLFKMIKLRHYVLLGVIVWTIGGFDLGHVNISHAENLPVARKSNISVSPSFPIPSALGSPGEPIVAYADYITQGYGYTSFAATNYNYLEPRHNGIDIAAKYGSEVSSANTGEVLYTGDEDNYCSGKAYGKFVVVEDVDGIHEILYAHLSEVDVNKGDEINRGDKIGLIGQTGYATGPHLHFSVFLRNGFQIIEDKHCGPKPEGKDINPLDYLNG